MVKYTCFKCGKEDEYDPRKAVVLHARKESEQLGRDVYYLVIRCNHCGARNERKPPAK